MMYLIGKGMCPSCGIRGKIWKKSPDIFRCPSCSSFYNEFGLVVEPKIAKGDEST
jgi:ribosomal protein L37AE/L43A